MIKFSDDILIQFEQLQSELTDNCFAMGDLCVSVCDEYSHLYKHADIVRALADQTGGQYDTLRDRERVSRAIPYSARMQYPLSFHQWRACLSHQSNPIDIAEWAVSQDRIPTVAEIRVHVYGIDGDLPAWQKRFEKLKDLANDIVSDDDAPGPIIDVLVQVLSLHLD